MSRSPTSPESPDRGRDSRSARARLGSAFARRKPQIALTSAWLAGFVVLVGFLNWFAPAKIDVELFDPLPSVATAPASETRELHAAPPALFQRLPVGRRNQVFEFENDGRVRESSSVTFASTSSDPSTNPRLVEFFSVPGGMEATEKLLRVEYSLDAELTERIARILRTARMRLGHVIVLDPRSGRVLAYVSTDPINFSPIETYPAASIVKVVTAAAALEVAPAALNRPCRFRGSPYRLTRTRLRPPKIGRETSFELALAMSNNQCFAQLAVNALGPEIMMAAIDRFGWLESAAPGHSAGRVEIDESDYDLGRLGSGLSGLFITPLHSASLAASLADGTLIEPWWVDRVLDANGQVLELPPRHAPQRVMSSDIASELRRMMVRTTTRGTARSAFRDRRGRPKLGSIKVAGKTGNLSGRNPKGRYEWFIGTAPADSPSIAIAVVQVHGHLWWMRSSEVAANVLQAMFCEGRSCSPERAHRYTGDLGESVVPVFLSDVAR